MTTMETFKRGDEVLSKLPGGSTMTVLAVEGMKVRCSDEHAPGSADTELSVFMGPEVGHGETKVYAGVQA